MELNESGNEYFAFESDVKEIEIANAEGSYLIDSDGNMYIDFTGGWCVGNLGWKNESVISAIKNFDGPTYVSPHYSYRPWVELAELLARITPGNLKKCFRATGGTEAVEIALQAAMTYTGRKKFIGVEGAFHGNSIATRGLVEDIGLFDWKKIKPPFNEARAEHLEDLLKDQDVAALIMEPIITNMNVTIPERKFMERMQDLCRKYGTLVIMDEVASGFGRTGKMFATEHFNISPDIMTLGKAITGGAAPMGATIMTEEVAEELQNGSFPYSTYGWHPLSTTAAITHIRQIEKDWHKIQENINSLGEYFAQRLSVMKFKQRPKVHIMGLAISVTFEDEEYGKELAGKVLEKGLLLSESGEIFPALNMDFETAKKGLDIIESSL